MTTSTERERALLLLARSGLLPGVGAAAFTALSDLLYGREPRTLVLAVAAAVTFFSYALDHLRDADDAPLRRQLRAALGLAGLLFVAADVAALRAGLPRVAAVSLIFPLSVGLYSFPVLRRGRYRRVKDLPLAKSVYVSFMWSLLSVLAAAGLDVPTTTSRVVVVAASLFVAAFCSAVASDIKDIADDRAGRIVTIPTSLGKRGTIRLLHFVNVAFGAGTIVLARAGLLPRFAVAMEVHTVAVALILVLMSRARREWLVSELGLDSAMTLLPLWCFLGKHLL